VRVILHPEAEAEILGAQRYYSEVRPALGRRFYDELSGLLLRVAERPLAFKQFAPPARRAFARHFPYAVVYVPRGEAVWIIAVMHVRRKPGYWKRRLTARAAGGLPKP
jgi:plasmid stabilization system protein ParE